MNDFPRSLRRNQTEVEKLLWKYIRDRQVCGVKFKRQQKIGKFIVDFSCYEYKIIIELDGGHHLKRKQYDKDRTKWLNEEGYTVLRFWDGEVEKNIDEVINVIASTIMSIKLKK